MLIPAGVVVPADLAGVVAELAGDGLRRAHLSGRVVDVRIHGLLAELRAAPVVADTSGSASSANGHRLLTTNAAAAMFGTSPRTVRRWAERGRITARRSGRAWTVELPP